MLCLLRCETRAGLRRESEDLYRGVSVLSGEARGPMRDAGNPVLILEEEQLLRELDVLYAYEAVL